MRRFTVQDRVLRWYIGQNVRFTMNLSEKDKRLASSASPLQAPPHDSGPLWLANPLTYDSFIHYNLPVYPGAQGA
ncbi:MAG TPA: hypothetical protein VGL29_06310 [Blastocatellia bacterium]